MNKIKISLALVMLALVGTCQVEAFGERVLNDISGFGNEIKNDFAAVGNEWENKEEAFEQNLVNGVENTMVEAVDSVGEGITGVAGELSKDTIHGIDSVLSRKKRDLRNEWGDLKNKGKDLMNKADDIMQNGLFRRKRDIRNEYRDLKNKGRDLKNKGRDLRNKSIHLVHRAENLLKNGHLRRKRDLQNELGDLKNKGKDLMNKADAVLQNGLFRKKRYIWDYNKDMKDKGRNLRNRARNPEIKSQNSVHQPENLLVGQPRVKRDLQNKLGDLKNKGKDLMNKADAVLQNGLFRKKRDVDAVDRGEGVDRHLKDKGRRLYKQTKELLKPLYQQHSSHGSNHQHGLLGATHQPGSTGLSSKLMGSLSSLAPLAHMVRSRSKHRTNANPQMQYQQHQPAYGYYPPQYYSPHTNPYTSGLPAPNYPSEPHNVAYPYPQVQPRIPAGKDHHEQTVF